MVFCKNSLLVRFFSYSALLPSLNLPLVTVESNHGNQEIGTPYKVSKSYKSVLSTLNVFHLQVLITKFGISKCCYIAMLLIVVNTVL